MLSDIEFDDDDMILGFRDRFGDLHGSWGFFRYSDFQETGGISAGDILRACYNGSSYTLETGSSGSCSSTGGLTNSGPNGVEYYHWDIFEERQLWCLGSQDNNGAYHWEVTQGGLLQLPGVSTVMTTVMDPYFSYSGGIFAFGE